MISTLQIFLKWQFNNYGDVQSWAVHQYILPCFSVRCMFVLGSSKHASTTNTFLFRSLTELWLQKGRPCHLRTASFKHQIIGQTLMNSTLQILSKVVLQQLWWCTVLSCPPVYISMFICEMNLYLGSSKQASITISSLNRSPTNFEYRSLGHVI